MLSGWWNCWMSTALIRAERAPGTRPASFFEVGRGTAGAKNVVGPGGHGDGLRRSHGEGAGASLGADPVERSTVNVGTLPTVPAVRAVSRMSRGGSVAD